ncbi:hypothetical protein MHY1_01259 [Methylovirgula sp. HY1]|nr:hypothetical protein MHY1_01259 [Methylovirgula sp. HY1]
MASCDGLLQRRAWVGRLFAYPEHVLAPCGQALSVASCGSLERDNEVRTTFDAITFMPVA